MPNYLYLFSIISVQNLTYSHITIVEETEKSLYRINQSFTKAGLLFCRGAFLQPCFFQRYRYSQTKSLHRETLIFCRQKYLQTRERPKDDEDRQMMGESNIEARKIQVSIQEQRTYRGKREEMEKGTTEMESFCKKRNWGIFEINNFEFLFFCIYTKVKNCMEMVRGL